MASRRSLRTDSIQSYESESKYYQHAIASEADKQAFRSLDDADVLRQSMHAISSSSCRNFLIDFSDKEAFVGFDLQTETIRTLLAAEDRPEDLNTRWINIWYPYHHRPLLEAIGKHYDFSPRLLAMMCSNPRKLRAETPARSSTRPPSRTNTGDGAGNDGHRDHSLSDLERGSELSEIASVTSNNPARTGNVYDIADDVWHYSSVDQGRNYICLGYNSIYNTGQLGDLVGIDQHSCKPPLPHCKRIWTWLILCDNRTLITVNEDPFPYSDGRLDHLESEILLETRRNLINVFRSLSHVELLSSASPLTLLPIRQRLGNTVEESAHRPSDAPGLLFYYLFENWFNSYSLVTRRDSRYGKELDIIREKMFDKPQLQLIDRLDRVGSQLGVLKRHYQSYIRLIDRVIEPPVATVTSLANSRVASKASQQAMEDAEVATIRPIVRESESMLGVALSSAARVRFERLKDIINLYALNEVKDYLAQKESLVQMNFQLIAIKESRDVERLTRVSLLITKATILFLPVSLMTAYFSTALSNTEYSVATYWITFGVVFGLSWVALVGFGVSSGTMETLAFFRPAKKIIMKLLGRRRDS